MVHHDCYGFFISEECLRSIEIAVWRKHQEINKVFEMQDLQADNSNPKANTSPNHKPNPNHKHNPNCNIPKFLKVGF